MYSLLFLNGIVGGVQLGPLATAATIRPIVPAPGDYGFFSGYECNPVSYESRLTWIMSLSLILRPVVSRPVCLGIKHPSGAYDQIFITVRQLRVCWGGVLSLTRGRVYRLQLLLAIASAVIFGSEFRGTRDHILMSHIRDLPFRRLRRLRGIRWRYSNPPPHGIILAANRLSLYSLASDRI
jgi:hypothetical protein